MATRKKKEVEKNAPKARVGDYGIILAPVITEKSSHVAADRSRVVFRVKKTATKIEIKEAIERVFGVKVQQVRTTNIWGKIKRTGAFSGRRPSFKKAYVTLKEGQTIDIVEGV